MCLFEKLRPEIPSRTQVLNNMEIGPLSPLPTGERAGVRGGSQEHRYSQGSNPIPRKITLVTVCTARSNCMSDNG